MPVFSVPAMGMPLVGYQAAMRPKKNVPPRFGWTQSELWAKPDRFKISLKASDITWTTSRAPLSRNGLRMDAKSKILSPRIPQDVARNKGNEQKIPRLKPAVIKTMLEKLSRTDIQNPETPGFVVIDNLDTVFKTPQAMEVFYRWLTIDMAEIVNNNPRLRRYYDLDSAPPEDKLLVGRRGYLADGHQKAYTALSGQTIDYPKFTHKSPHFDKGPILAGLLHLPVHGISGGVPEIYDLEDFVRRHPDPKRPATAKITRGKHTVDHDKDEIHPAILIDPRFQEYTMTLDRDPKRPVLILFNNKGNGRVAHGASAMTITNPADYSRNILRYTLHKPFITKPGEEKFVPGDNPQWAEDYPPLPDDQLK